MSWKNLGRPTQAFIVARGMSAFSLGIVVILLNLYFRAVGFDEAFMGKSLALFGLGCAFSSIPAGYLSDYLGCLNTMIIGEALLCLTLWGQISFSSETFILASSLIAGIGTSFIAVARQPYTASVARDRYRHSLFSYSYAVFLTMTVVGNFSGGLARRFLPQLSVACSYQYLLYVAGVLNVLSAGALYVSGRLAGGEKDHESAENGCGRKDMDIGHTSVSEPSNPFGTPCEKLPLARHSSISLNGADTSVIRATILKFGLVRLLIGIGSGLSIPFLNIYFKDSFSLSTFSIGIIFGAGSLVTAAFVMAGPLIAGKGGKVKVITWFQLVSLPFLIALSATSSILIAIGAFWSRGALMKTATPLFKSIVMSRIPRAYRGRAASVTVTMWHLGHSAGAYSGGKLISGNGFFEPFILTAVIYSLGAIIFYGLFRAIDDEEIVE